MAKFFSLLSTSDKCLLYISYISSLVTGLFIPSVALVLGAVINSYDPASTSTVEEIMLELVWMALVVCAIIWIFGFISYSSFQLLAEKVAIDLRAKYLRALMSQEVAFFEMNNVESMPSDMGQYFNTISLGIGESYSAIIQAFGTFLGGFAMSFYKGPVMALLCLIYAPIIVIAFTFLGGANKVSQFKKLEENQKLGGIAEEALQAIKLVVSFVQEENAIKRFEEQAITTRDVSKKNSHISAIFNGVIKVAFFGFMIYCLYVGSVLIE